MEELIKTVSERAGINPEQAKTAVASVIDFIKAKVPLVGEQVQSVIGNGGKGGASVADAAESLKKKFGF